MPRKKDPNAPKAKMGRPKIEIDWKQFDKLCAIQCTLVEIAEYFNCTDDTIENRVKQEKGVTFSEYFAQKRGAGKRSLRRVMFEKALSGNVTMMIWLSKQYLGMRDKTEVETSEKPYIIEKLDGSEIELGISKDKG